MEWILFGTDEQVQTGFLLEVENTHLLTETQRQSLVRKLRILAVSTQGLCDDSVLVKEQTLAAYYPVAYYAQETLKHIQKYLDEIDVEKKITVTLQAAQWLRRE